MNTITIGIIIVAFGLAFVYMMMKNSCVNGLTKNLKANNYDGVLENAEKPLTRKMLGDYHCDLFMMRAYYLKNDMEHLKEKALEMLSCDYKLEQEKAFLELYYHIFLNLTDFDMANRFLDKIVKIEDPYFVKYNQYTYNILVEKQNDLIDVMEAEIAAKAYEGFALGTVVYLIAMQYLYKEDYADAELYFKECLTCFHPNDFYVGQAKAHLKDLETKEY